MTQSPKFDGELRTQTTVIAGETYPTNWTYDAVGRRQTMAYPSGLTLTYGYDAYGQLNQATSDLGGTDSFNISVPKGLSFLLAPPGDHQVQASSHAAEAA